MDRQPGAPTKAFDHRAGKRLGTLEMAGLGFPNQNQSRIWIQRNGAVLRACQLLQAVAICNSITLLLT